MEPFEITLYDALRIILRHGIIVFGQEYSFASISYEEIEASEKNYHRGQGVYIFTDYCSIENPKIRPSDGSRDYSVIRNIGETNNDFFERFRHKKFTWNEVILIRMPKSEYNPSVQRQVNPQAKRLQNFLLDRIRCAHNKHKQSGKRADIFVTSLSPEKRQLQVEKYEKTFEQDSSLRP